MSYLSWKCTPLNISQGIQESQTQQIKNTNWQEADQLALATDQICDMPREKYSTFTDLVQTSPYIRHKTSVSIGKCLRGKRSFRLH